MRIRSIKPAFFTHEGIFEAEKEFNLPLRLAFIGLWCAADREGRFKWEPRRLGIQILPYDGIDFSRVLDALSTRGFIRQYRVGDATFGCIPSWNKHQVINNRETQSDLPGPVDNEGVDASGTREPRVDHASKGEGKGREYGKEGRGGDMHASALGDFDPSRVRMIEAIVTAYCANGNEVEARRGVIAALDSGMDPEELLAKTKVHTARIKSLPMKERRFVPGKVSYFAERRFNDDPDSHPWVCAQDVEQSETSRSKPTCTPDEEERRRKERERNQQADEADIAALRAYTQKMLARKSSTEDYEEVEG